MPLTSTDVRSRLLDADRVIRDIALDYFRDGVPSRDEATVAAALQAIDRYGWWQSFSRPSTVASLRQTEQSIQWFIDHVDVWTAEPPEGSLAAELARDFGYGDAAILVVRGLTQVDVDLLRRFEKELASLPYVNDEYREAINERLQTADADPEAVWAELCEAWAKDAQEWSDALWSRIEVMQTEVGRHGEQFGERVLSVLAKTDVESTLGDSSAVRLAGMMRLREAVPILIDKLLSVAEDELMEDLEEALSLACGDDVVRLLIEKYAAAPRPFKESTAVVLERLRSPAATTAALDLAAREADDELRHWLLRAALRALDERSVEPTRQDLLTRPKGEDHIELRSDLLQVCRFHGATFPEHDAWVEDSKHDREYLRSYRTARFAADRILADHPDSDYDVDDDADYEAEPRLQAVATAGRNDPCPCGSGKKYKKCCMRTDRS